MKKYAMSLLHFNLQFVAGETETYHREVRESFSPILDLLRNHPGWKVDLELQGLMVEFMAEHYPVILKKLKSLTERGQVELVSCHYSDQIWVAFPREDMIRSIRLNDAVLAKHGLRRSRVFFTQENFSGEGVRELTEFFDCCILRSSYYTWFHAIDELQPYYRLGNIKALIAPDMGRTEDITWTWGMCADGETTGVDGMPTQTAEFFLNPGKLADFERRMTALHESGYEPATVTEFVSHVDRLGYEAPALKPILDGAWHMAVCRGVFQWMGFYANDYEDDCTVRSHNIRSRNRLLAAQTLCAYAAERNVPVDDQAPRIEEAWKHQVLAEASDSTGWGPTPAEVHYAVAESETVLNIVQSVLDTLKDRLGLGLIEVDTDSGEVAAFDGARHTAPGPMRFHDQDMGSRWGVYGADGRSEYYLEDGCRLRHVVTFVPSAETSGVSLRYDVDYLQYSPALMEEKLVRYPLAAFRSDHLYLPLPNGLITVRENFHVIKHNDSTHVACHVDKTRHEIRFEVEKAPRKEFRWQFTCIFGPAEEALSWANRINVRPRVVV